ncbi:MAG: hypothetical protein J6M60_02160 [Clostridia bacterium]|nr:hypothetical protein [Clostridia bacterium]
MPSSVLQIIAMVTMAIDHIAYIQTYGNAHVIFLNFIGRIAFPIFCFQIALGYKKTKDLGKYILRLLVVAGISQIPYFLFFNKVALMKPGLNVIFTLLFGIIAILIYDFTIENNKENKKKIKINTGLNFGEKYKNLSIPKMIVLFILKIVGIVLICYLAHILGLEYGAIGVILTLSMFVFYPFKYEKNEKEDKEKQEENEEIKSLKIIKIFSFIIVTCIFAYIESKSYFRAVFLGNNQYLDELIGLFIGCVIGCMMPFLYNGKKGKKLKIFGYIFYPLQFAIIVLINMLIH